MSTSSAAAHVDPSARVLTASSAVLRAQVGALVMFVVVGMCVVSSLLGHVSVMTSEALARAGSRGRLVVLEARMRSKGRGLAGPGRSLVSMVLTSTPHRRRPPKKNRRIPTIPAGNIDGRLVDVSAVDTGPCRSESGVLGGTARRLRHRSAPCPLPARGPVEGRPFEITDMALPAACAGARRLWFDAGSALSLASSRPTPRGSGSTGQWLCVLHEGPTYPQYPQPSSSSTPPSCSASRRRR